MSAAGELLRELEALRPGAPIAEIRRRALKWKRQQTESPDEKSFLTELDGLFRHGSREGRLAAIELALADRPLWNKRWGGLFLRWARSRDVEPEDIAVGSKLIGPLWVEGLIEPRQLAALALWPEVGPWRAGLAALSPSLSQGSRDWPLLETFLSACLGEEARFAGRRPATNAARSALRAAGRANGDLVADWLQKHEPELPAGLAEAFGPMEAE